MTNPFSNDSMVDQALGSAYQVVRYVAANMDTLIELSNALPTLETYMEDIVEVLDAMPVITNVNSNLAAITNVATNMSVIVSVNTNMAALLNINSNMAAILAVPAAIQSLDFKNSVAVATTGNITLSGLQTIDGYLTPSGIRVLVKDQTTPAENGIYVTASGAWTRAADAVTGNLGTNATVMVDRGTANVGKRFRLETLGTITVGTTAQSWVRDTTATSVTGQDDEGGAVAVTAPATAAYDNMHFSLTVTPSGYAVALSTEILDAIASGGGGGGSGEVNTASNLGTGFGLYSTKVGSDLRFKSLAAGTNVTINDDGSVLTINASGGSGGAGLSVAAVDDLGDPTIVEEVAILSFDDQQFYVDGDAASLGLHLSGDALQSIGGVSGGSGTGASGFQLYKDKVDTTLRFKTLIAGSGMSISEDVDNNSLTLTASGGGGGGSLLVEGVDSGSNDVSETVTQIYFNADDFTLSWDPSDGGWMSVLAKGGGGGGGVPEAPNDGKQYVRADLDWVEYKFNQSSMMNMGTISLVSPSTSEDNRMKFRGLVEKVVEGNKEILITPVTSGESSDLNDLQIGLNPRYKSEWDGYFDGAPYWNERLALGGDCNIDSAITTAISAFTANTVFAYPFYVPIGGTIFENLGLIFDTSTRPASGNLEVSIAKMSGNYMTILSYHTFVWSVLNQTPQLSPAVELDEPGVYVAFLRTTTNAATWKSARKVNATPALRMGTDPASKVLMDSLQPRWSIAWKFTSLDPLTVGWTVGYESLDGTGVTTAPYVELLTAFTGG